MIGTPTSRNDRSDIASSGSGKKRHANPGARSKIADFQETRSGMALSSIRDLDQAIGTQWNVETQLAYDIIQTLLFYRQQVGKQCRPCRPLKKLGHKPIARAEANTTASVSEYHYSTSALGHRRSTLKGNLLKRNAHLKIPYPIFYALSVFTIHRQYASPVEPLAFCGLSPSAHKRA